MYINGILQYNILYLYYETKQEKDILKKRKFKFIKDYAYSIYNLDNSVNYRLIQPKQLTAKFKKIYVDIRNKKEIEPVYMTQFIDGKLTKQLITGKNNNDILFFNAVNVIYDVNNNKLLQAPNLIDYKVLVDLFTKNNFDRKTIKDIKNNDNIEIEYDTNKHSYYNEVVDKDKTSYAIDNILTKNLDLFVEKINNDFNSFNKLYDNVFNKLLTALQKPAVVGTPPLLPNEVLEINQAITSIKQELTNKKTSNYDIIKDMQTHINSYITSKVKSDEELEGMEFNISKKSVNDEVGFQ